MKSKKSLTPAAPGLLAPITIHKVFEKDALNMRDVIWYVSDGSSLENVHKVCGIEHVEEYANSIASGGTARFTSVSGSDLLLVSLQERGVRIEYCHWHDSGVEKSLPPAEIAFQFARLDPKVIRVFTPDVKLVELRRAITSRVAILDFYNDAVRRLKGAARNAGITTDDQLTDDLAILDQVKKVVGTVPVAKKNKAGTETTRMVSWDTRVEQLAKDIPECVLFAEVAGFESMGTAATIVAYANGVSRFRDVASFWTFCGQGVVDGRAPKLKAGSPANWSPKVRVACHQMMSSIMKNTKNPWNAVLKQYKEEELAVHMEKHPGCKTPAGHSQARANRKVAKEILKRFYLAATAQQYVANHNPVKIAEAPSKRRKKAA